MPNLKISQSVTPTAVSDLQRFEELLQERGCRAGCQIKEISRKISYDEGLSDLYRKLEGKKRELQSLLPNEASLQRSLLQVLYQEEIKRQDEILMRNTHHELQSLLHGYIGAKQLFLADRLMCRLPVAGTMAVLTAHDHLGRNAALSAVAQGCQQLIQPMTFGLTLQEKALLLMAEDKDKNSAAQMLLLAATPATVQEAAQALFLPEEDVEQQALAIEALIRSGLMDPVRHWWKTTMEQGRLDALFFKALAALPNLTYFILKRQRADLRQLQPAAEKRSAYLEVWVRELSRQTHAIHHGDQHAIVNMLCSYLAGRGEPPCVYLLANVFLLAMPEALRRAVIADDAAIPLLQKASSQLVTHGFA